MTIEFRATVTKYQNRTSGATIDIRANFSEATSPIEVRYDGGNWQTTQFQVADARHDPRNALLLLLKWEG